MLKRFSVKNYKNFKDEIVIDFGAVAGYQFGMDCLTDNLLSKILIYGRNATGKTNLGGAIMDITQTLSSPSRFFYDEMFLNADSPEDSANFSYTFIFNESELTYQYDRFSSLELKHEMLIVDGAVIFECDFPGKKYDFDNLKKVQAGTVNCDIYLKSLYENNNEEQTMEPKLPFLRWLISNMALDNDSILLKLANYVRRMTLTTAGNKMRSRFFSSSLYDSFENSHKLEELEDFLNVMGIDCKLNWRKLPDGHGQLYFVHEKLVPFYETASSGTRVLVDLYFRLFSKTADPSFLFLDEFDAFYHYEMAESIIKFVKNKYHRCQIIMTSHNTNLMNNRLMRPDCMFILSSKGTLTALCNATQRELREGHNLEKMYISGEFEKYE